MCLLFVYVYRHTIHLSYLAGLFFIVVNFCLKKKKSTAAWRQLFLPLNSSENYLLNTWIKTMLFPMMLFFCLRAHHFICYAWQRPAGFLNLYVDMGFSALKYNRVQVVCMLMILQVLLKHGKVLSYIQYRIKFTLEFSLKSIVGLYSGEKRQGRKGNFVLYWL